MGGWEWRGGLYKGRTDMSGGGHGGGQDCWPEAGIYCVGHFPLPSFFRRARDLVGLPVASQRGSGGMGVESLALEGGDRGVSGFGERWLGLLGRMQAKKGEMEAPVRRPAPGQWANEKHTPAGTVFTREFNYPGFPRRCLPSVFGGLFFFLPSN